MYHAIVSSAAPVAPLSKLRTRDSDSLVPSETAEDVTRSWTSAERTLENKEMAENKQTVYTNSGVNVFFESDQK